MPALPPSGSQDLLTHRPLGQLSRPLGFASPLGPTQASIGRTFQVLQLALEQSEVLSEQAASFDEFDFPLETVSSEAWRSDFAPSRDSPLADSPLSPQDPLEYVCK